MARSRRQVRKLNVCAVLPLYPPSSRVGAWLATHECLRYLAARGHTVRVVTYMSSERPYELDGVNVLPRSTPAGEALSGSDIVLSHLGDNGNAVIEARERGIPCVRMAHGSHPDNLLRLEAAPPALVVFNSQSLADEVGWSGCSVVVHPPVDVESFAGVKPGNRVTLINLSKEKGGHLFWDLAVAMPHVQFLGVRGGYGEQISNKRKNVRLIDPTADMAADVYGQTRMLLMPSERETWGRTAVEAMAAGIPVIAHPTPGLCESLGPAGTFVDRDDTEGWVAQINRLSSKSEWAVASHASSVRAAELDPAPQLARFAKAVEAAA